MRNFSWPLPTRQGPGESFLYLGRLVAEKGISDLLEAWRELEAPLTVAGGGPMRAQLDRSAVAGVRFTGPLTAAQVAEAVSRARAVIVPSAWLEPGSRAVVEAASAGVPAVASRVGGLPELVQDGVTGLLVEPGDPGDLADAVTRLLEDGTSERLGSAAAGRWREQFSPEVRLTELQRAYARAMAA